MLELFLELGASEEQANFPVIYANGRAGIAMLKLADESKDLTPLLDMILQHVPSASSEELSARPLRFQPFNLGYDNFLGRLALGRVHDGVLKQNSNVFYSLFCLQNGNYMASGMNSKTHGELKQGYLDFIDDVIYRLKSDMTKEELIKLLEQAKQI